jgi:hypothetical protein
MRIPYTGVYGVVYLRHQTSLGMMCHVNNHVNNCNKPEGPNTLLIKFRNEPPNKHDFYPAPTQHPFNNNHLVFFRELSTAAKGIQILIHITTVRHKAPSKTHNPHQLHPDAMLKQSATAEVRIQRRSALASTPRGTNVGRLPALPGPFTDTSTIPSRYCCDTSLYPPDTLPILRRSSCKIGQEF